MNLKYRIFECEFASVNFDASCGISTGDTYHSGVTSGRVLLMLRDAPGLRSSAVYGVRRIRFPYEAQAGNIGSNPIRQKIHRRLKSRDTTVPTKSAHRPVR